VRLRSHRRSSSPSFRSQPSPLISDLFARAQHEAITLRHEWIGTEHVLLALLADDADPAARALRRLGLDAAAVRRDVLSIVGAGPPSGSAFDAEALRAIGIDLDVVRARVEETFGTGALDRAERARGRCGAAGFGVAPRLKQALERSAQEAEREGRGMTAGDVIVGLALQRDAVAARILALHGITPGLIQGALMTERPGEA
jgi:ATP-dependent Clp protease ATP-binding subunit ClpA